jgi:hypothetical protein
MSLDISKLEKVRGRGNKTIARCPACAEAGNDKAGEHLFINKDGKFGCVLYPGDAAEAKKHRRRIFALCGDRKIKNLVVRSVRDTNVPDTLQSEFGTLGTSKSRSKTLKTGLLGRLGRFSSYSGLYTEGTLRRDIEYERRSKLLSVPAVPKLPEAAPLTLVEIRQVFPSARSIEEAKPKPKATAKKCITCGTFYNGWPESEYCSNECAKKHDTSKNPSKERIQYLRRQCRLTWQRAADRVAPDSFETWLRNFEARVERMREQAKSNNQ